MKSDDHFTVIDIDLKQQKDDSSDNGKIQPCSKPAKLWYGPSAELQLMQFK